MSFNVNCIGFEAGLYTKSGIIIAYLIVHCDVFPWFLCDRHYQLLLGNTNVPYGIDVDQNMKTLFENV